ncbi:MAG: hypothetical protein A2252_08820 [Elusimicrobia bacterium RIFOXYA2_FULL_39_19]|nr:MAG: hypothetical protein A2252_08820 [Elusimicrobia bacterium RIFOXYA2_FULL_39_19]
MSETSPETKQIQIEVDEQTSQGVYCNLAMIGHSETEFVFDFIFVQPQAPKGKVRSRVITSPAHVKRLLMAINENIKKYEERFGEIKTVQQPAEEKKVGFYH